MADVGTIPGLDELVGVVEQGMENLQVPGVALGVVLGEAEHISGYGITNVNAPVAVDEDTVFQIGSTGKTITATVIMRLANDGRIELDAPVQRYIPEFTLADADAASLVTIRHLLTHTGGFEGDLFEDLGPGDDALAKFVERMAGLEQYTPPGEIWGYANAGYSLLGRVIEVITGSTYEAAVRELVLEPLGMTRSFFFADEAILHRVAAGHSVMTGTPSVIRPWALPRTMAPAGGMAASMRDQLTYAKFHLGRGPDILPAGTLKLMQTAQVAAGGGYAHQCGLGWLIQRTPGVIAHGGSANGQESAFVIVPEKQFALAVTTNSDSGVILQRNVAKHALRNIARMTPDRPSLTPLADDKLDAIAGSFRGPLNDVLVERTATGLALGIRPRESMKAMMPDTAEIPPVEVAAYEGGGFRVEGGALRGAQGEFLSTGDGSVAWLRMNGRLHKRV